jgi:hypothetical protein
MVPLGSVGITTKVPYNFLNGSVVSDIQHGYLMTGVGHKESKSLMCLAVQAR